MVAARLTPQAKAALIRQHLDDGALLTRLAAAAGLTGPHAAALGRQLSRRPDRQRARTLARRGRGLPQPVRAVMPVYRSPSQRAVAGRPHPARPSDPGRQAAAGPAVAHYRPGRLLRAVGCGRRREQRAAGRARDRGGGLHSGAGRHHGAGRPQPAVAGRRGGRRRVGRPGRAGGARPAPHRAAGPARSRRAARRRPGSSLRHGRRLLSAGRSVPWISTAHRLLTDTNGGVR